MREAASERLTVHGDFTHRKGSVSGRVQGQNLLGWIMLLSLLVIIKHLKFNST